MLFTPVLWDSQSSPFLKHRDQKQPWELVGNTLPPSSHRRPTTSNLGAMHKPFRGFRCESASENHGVWQALGREAAPARFQRARIPRVLQIPSSWSSPAEDYAGEVQTHRSSRWHRKLLWGACCAHCLCALFLPPPNRPVGLMFLHSYDPVLCPPNSYDEALTACTPERDCVWRWAFKELNETFGVALVQSDWSPWTRG